MADAAEVLKEARERLQAAWDYDQENRREALTDLEFLEGDQWPALYKAEREKEGRPCLVLDKLNQHKNQVVNDIRQAKIAIKAVGVDSNTDPQLAEVYTALMRDIQYQSNATHVYSWAADGAVSCGIGHMRVTTEYARDAVSEQDIRIKSVPYPLSVYWDPAAVEPDRSDALWCFVTEFIPEATFKELYPDAKQADVDAPGDSLSLSWTSKDGVLVAEYWKKVKTKRKLVAIEGEQTLDVTDVDESELAGLRIIGEREADGFKVEQYLVSGQEVLEGPNAWAGMYIPIIPVIGSERFLERRRSRRGLIRLARDGQQLYNYHRTAAAEAIALAPKAKWLATAKQIAARIGEWLGAHRSPRPFLIYEPDDRMPGGKPELVPPPEPPAALWREAELADSDIKSATGIYNPSLGDKSNETSGVAIAQRQREGDVANYHFSDNLNRALQHLGRVIIDLIGKVYDTQRTVRIMGDDDESDFIPINAPVMSVDGESLLLNDMSKGRFDVRVDIGPSYTTQRMEAATAMLDYFKADTEALAMARDIFVRAMDWPEAEELSERFKRAVPPQLLGEDEQPPPQPPDLAQQQAQELELKGVGAKVAETEGKARKAHAEADAKELENQERAAQDQLYGVPPPQHAIPPTPGEGGPSAAP